MRLIPQCSKCHRPLTIKDTKTIPGTNELVIEIKPCGNIDCYDCSKCDGTLKLANNELKRQLKTANEELNKLKGKSTQ